MKKKQTQEYLAAVETYHRREDLSQLKKLVRKQKSANRREQDRKRKNYKPDLEAKPPVFKNGGALRDYQRTVIFHCLFSS